MANKVNAHIIWDLSHAVGAIPIDLSENEVDFAVGCTYKYLNCGPGGPAFLYANKKHHDRCCQPLTGWIGSENPFKMNVNYKPARGIAQFLTGAQSVITMSMVNHTIDIFIKADMKIIREKSLALSDLLIELIEQKCPSLILVSSRDHKNRGSHISFEHPNGFAISKLCRQKRVICDYRHPNLIRFALAPLYLRFVDLWDAVEIICFAVENAAFEVVDGKIEVS